MDRKVDELLFAAACRQVETPAGTSQVSVSIGKIVVNVGVKRRRNRRGGSRAASDASEGVANYVSDTLESAGSICPTGVFACLAKIGLKSLFLLHFYPPVPV